MTKIKTKNLLENLDFTSYDSDNVPKVVQKIKKVKVLNTPDGVNNWIFYTDELKVKNDEWLASKAIFTNDLLESDQINFVINNLKIIPRNDSLELKTSINFLVLEDRISIPFWFGNRTIRDSEQGYLFGLQPKWFLGFDNLDKDGYFIGRKFNSIDISDNFVLDLEPQFLIQRSLKGYTKSFVNKDESITSDRVKRNTSFEDYFALRSRIKGTIKNWDLEIDKNLNSLDFDKFSDAFRFKAELSKEIDLLDSK